MSQSNTLPLIGLQVLDLCDRIGQSCGRFLADLGAEVILIEPEKGMCSRNYQPLIDGRSLHFEVRNANKTSVTIDLTLEEGRQQELQLKF